MTTEERKAKDGSRYTSCCFSHNIMAFKHQALRGELRSGIFFFPFIYKTNKQNTGIYNYFSIYILSQCQEFNIKSKIYLSIYLPPGNFCTILFKKFLMYCLSVAWGETVFEFASSLIDIMIEKCAFFFFSFVSTFSHHLRKQFSPKPWQIKASTIVKHLYGMLIKNWQGETSWGQILKHLFSLKSHWI